MRDAVRLLRAIPVATLRGRFAAAATTAALTATPAHRRCLT
jgi:hypothetical protein